MLFSRGERGYELLALLLIGMTWPTLDSADQAHRERVKGPGTNEELQHKLHRPYNVPSSRAGQVATSYW